MPNIRLSAQINLTFHLKHISSQNGTRRGIVTNMFPQSTEFKYLENI